MYAEDINIESFIENIKKQKVFKNLYIEDYNYTLSDYILDDFEFHECFVNINFSNCSFKGAKFTTCNLKCISFQNCDMTNCTISDCSIESLTIKDCNIKGINFGTNYAYGATLLPEDCLLHFSEGNSAQ